MTYAELWRTLTAVYDEGEAKAIARLVLEDRFGLTMADVLCGRMPDEAELQAILRRLLSGEPVQYVLGRAMFCGRPFGVAPGVLIPRPETEELCRWVVEEVSLIPTKRAPSILDIGTGSGCIACTLAAELPAATVTAWDISDAALAIARDNAMRLAVSVNFQQVDVLGSQPSCIQSSSCPSCGEARFSLIVSNPPYICDSERTAMARNVLDHEPHQALFVPDDDPLLFYRAISNLAQHVLEPDGALYFEINPLHADRLRQLLLSKGFRVELRADQYGKTRFTKAKRI